MLRGASPEKGGPGRNIPGGGHSPAAARRLGGARRGGLGCRGSKSAGLERSLQVGVQAVHFRQGPPTTCKSSANNTEHRAPEDSRSG